MFHASYVKHKKG